MPINYPPLLQTLSDNADDICALRQTLIRQCPSLQTDSWWLFGTDGCHLCENINKDLSIIKKSYNIPNIQVVDIIELDEQILTQMATHIPILITQKAVLNYPFGIMDIIHWH